MHAPRYRWTRALGRDGKRGGGGGGCRDVVFGGLFGFDLGATVVRRFTPGLPLYLGGKTASHGIVRR